VLLQVGLQLPAARCPLPCALCLFLPLLYLGLFPRSPRHWIDEIGTPVCPVQTVLRIINCYQAQWGYSPSNCQWVTGSLALALALVPSFPSAPPQFVTCPISVGVGLGVAVQWPASRLPIPSHPIPVVTIVHNCLPPLPETLRGELRSIRSA
jgi:hypothetical protein